MRTLIGMGAVLGLLVLVASARADEKVHQKVPLDDLPKAVRDAAKNRFPEGEIKSAYLREENGQQSYELKVKHGDSEQTVRLTREGKFLETRGGSTEGRYYTQGPYVQGRYMRGRYRNGFYGYGPYRNGFSYTPGPYTEGQVVQGGTIIEEGPPPPPARRRLLGRRNGGERRGLLRRFSRR